MKNATKHQISKSHKSLKINNMFWRYFVFLSFCGIIVTFRRGLNKAPSHSKFLPVMSRHIFHHFPKNIYFCANVQKK
jgi:hypothetical protein